MSLKASGSSRGQGRVAEGHHPDDLRLRPRRGRDPPRRHRRAGPRHAATRRRHVVNAGDGKHQHPTQCLLDLYTMREALGRLDGLQIAIVGDVLHSRVARSNIQGFAMMGADVLLVGPPTLIPRGIEATGVRVSHDIADIADADVVYVLRMQHERMQEGANFVPDAARVHGALGRHPRPRAPEPVRHAPGADEPRRRDRRRRGRRGPVADPAAGRGRPRDADGRALRPRHAAARATAASPSPRRWRLMARPLVQRAGAPRRPRHPRRPAVDPAEGLDTVADLHVRDGVIAAIGAELDAGRAPRCRGRRA